MFYIFDASCLIFLFKSAPRQYPGSLFQTVGSLGLHRFCWAYRGESARIFVLDLAPQNLQAPSGTVVVLPTLGGYGTHPQRLDMTLSYNIRIWHTHYNSGIRRAPYNGRTSFFVDVFSRTSFALASRAYFPASFFGRLLFPGVFLFLRAFCGVFTFRSFISNVG